MAKRIEIQMATVGADAAAAEVRKVEAAQQAVIEQAKQAEVAGSRGFGGMLDGVPARADEVEQSIKKIGEAAVPVSDHLGEVADEIDQIGKSAEGAGPKLDKIANIQRAQVANELAKGFGQIGNAVRETADKFQESDPKFAESLSSLADGLEMASSAASGAAQGFAVGGPFGAAVGALIGGAMVALKNAFNEMNEELVAAAKSQGAAADMAAKLAQMQDLVAGGYHEAADASDRLKQSTEDATVAIEEQVSALERRNRIQAADDKAYAAQRDREDAAAIRGGANEQDVKIKRAQDDAVIAKRRIDQEEEAKQAGLRDARNAEIRAEGEKQVIDLLPSATQEQRDAAAKAVQEARKRREEMEAEAEEARRIAAARRTEIDNRTGQTVDKLQAEKEEKAEKARQDEARKAQQENDRKKREQAQQERRQSGSRRGQDREAGALGAEAVDMIPEGTRQQGREAIERIAKGLKDGDQGGELAELYKLLGQMADNLSASDAGRKSEIQALRTKISNLEGQIKNGRTGK